MTKVLAAIILTAGCLSVRAQQISQITFADATTVAYLTVSTDQDVLIRITPDGKILEYGTELQSMRSSNYFAPKLQAYLGRVDYFGSDADSAFRGKVKSIGTCALTYYAHYDEPAKVGKLKSIGTLQLDYYSIYDNVALRGKLRFIGSAILEYYSSLEDEAVRGKLKTVSNTPITYYSTFDDKLIRGKIKSIGTVSYQWYTSYDKSELRGALKSGPYRMNVGSITFILR